MTTWTLGSEAEGLVIQVTAQQEGDDVHFTVQVLYGSANVNALYWSDGDGTQESSLMNFTGAKSENSLNMNGTAVVWDGGYKLSDAGLGKTPPLSYLTAGDSIEFTVSNLSIADFQTLGIRATSTSTVGGSIKWVADEPDPDNQPPTAIDDSAIAQEAGGIDNTSPGTDPTGNVLGNDTDDSPGLTVTAVRTGAENESGTSGTVGSPLQGTYGTLTLNADGSYTYEVDQDNPDVQALSSADQTLTESFTYTVTDAGGLSDSATLTITIQGQNDAPVVSVNGEGSFISGGSPELIDNTIGVTDVDDSMLEGATISIDNFNAGDQLHFTDQGGISGSYDSSTGVLTLSGDATLEDYRAALESITFSTTSENTAPRTISYVLYDGTHHSAFDTGTMSIVVLGLDPNDTADNPDTAGSNPGNDSLSGTNFDDNIGGGAGNDTISGGNGKDTLYGGSGNDSISGGNLEDLLYGDGGNDTLDGGTQDDTLHGGTGADTLIGDNGADQLYGDAGNDSLQGGNGDDTLYGGSGNDIIGGDNGVDIIYGGFGADKLTGGNDADTFVFLSVSDRKDTIEDFDPTQDKIDLSAIFPGSESLTDLLNANKILLQQVDADGDSYMDDVRILIDTDGSVPANPDVGPSAPVVLVDVLNTTLASLDQTNLLV